MQQWVEDTDVDGFNLTYVVAHDTFEKIVDLLVPELQKRGVYQTSYKEGTLRQKIFGHDYLPENHPAQKYRKIQAK